MSAVYIMFQEELTTRTSISLSASQSELTSLFLIKGPTNLSQRAPYSTRQAVPHLSKLEETLYATRQHCHANRNLLKHTKKANAEPES